MSEYICCNDKNGIKILDFLETVIEDLPKGLQSFELHFGLDEVLTIRNMCYHPKTKDKVVSIPERGKEFSKQILIKAKPIHKEESVKDKASEAIKSMGRYLGVSDFTAEDLTTIEQGLKAKDEQIKSNQISNIEHTRKFYEGLEKRDKEITKLLEINEELNIEVSGLDGDINILKGRIARKDFLFQTLKDQINA